MNKKIIIIVLLAFAISAFGSYAFFSKNPSLLNQSSITQPIPTPGMKNGQVAFDATLPKTETCPLNGVMYSTQQRAWWSKHRPLGVMIENHVDARPQSGLSYADVVYEAVAEGGITRFLSVFYCQDAPEVGPVRSARTYFLDYLSEYGNNPLYAHVGGANADGEADALGQLDSYGWSGYNDLNQFSIGFPVFWRDYDRLGHTVATEHTMYSTTGKLWDYAAQNRSITNLGKNGQSWDTTFIPYTFKDDAVDSGRGSAQVIHLEFWTGDADYYVDWSYNPTTNIYSRSNGGTAHQDKDTNKQLTTKNLVVLMEQETHANDGYENNVHLLYEDKGTGKAVVFQDGKKIQATWKKADRTSRTQLVDATGKAIALDRGTIWFSILPLDGVLSVK